MEQMSVSDLQRYWKTLHSLKEGEAIDDIALSQMPPWSDICSELIWKFHRTDGGYFANKNHGRSGVYRIVALGSDGDLTKPVTFNRACGHDTTGTLYIGCAKNLSHRLNQLRRALRNKDSHGAIDMLKTIPLLKRHPKELAIALLFTGPAVRCVEGDLIKAYINSFGDTPPLNYQR
jgi:hypothetical protein